LVRFLSRAVEFGGTNTLELIQRALQSFCSGRRLAFEGSDHERLLLLRVLAEIEELARPIELEALVEGLLPYRHVVTLAR
jgi:hypothetical protein